MSFVKTLKKFSAVSMSAALLFTGGTLLTEVSSGGIDVNAASSVGVSVPTGAKQFGKNYYKVYSAGKTWNDAESYCESLGGHLVTITSPEEQTFIEGLLKDLKKNSYWIGGRKKSDKSWKWITNEAFSYTNWAKGEPNNWTKEEENSILIYNSVNPNNPNERWTWNDLSEKGVCDDEPFFGLDNIGFICEWEIASLENNSTISAASIAADTEVTLNGKATGGVTPYKFAYYYKKSTDSTWTKAYVTASGSAYTKNTSVTFKPTSAGTYSVKINAKDDKETVAAKEFKLTVTAALKNKSTVSATSVTSGTAVTLNGKAEGGTSPYKFAYYYKKSTDSTWTKAYVTASGSAYTKNTSVSFKPASAGTYNVKINAKDDKGTVVAKEFKLTVTAALKNKSTVSATSVTSGTAVTLNGKAEGGTSPYKFAYYYKKSTDSTWTKAYVTASGSAYTKNTSVSFKPASAGTYNVKINAKDDNGAVDSKDFTITVKADSALKNISSVSAGTATLETGITIAGKAEGGTPPYKYAYYYKKKTETSWTVLDKKENSSYSTNTTAKFKPSDQGDYNLRVNIKDSKDNLAQKDFTVKISGWKYVKISGKVYDPDGNVITGATIKLLDKDNTVVASTTSDAAGYSIDFLINETGDYSVKFEYAGYDPVVKSLIEVQEDRVVNAMFANAEQKVYSQYFWLDPAILSQYSSIQMIDEYGIRLDVNEDAIVKKVAAYMYKEGDTWYRSIAFVGENVTKARYMPYLAYNDVIYFDATNAMINVFSLSQDSSGIWSRDGSFGTSKVNISDADGNYLTVYSKNIVGKNCKIFDNKEEMKAWLLAD